MNLAMPELFAVEEFLGGAVNRLKMASGAERGAVFTRVEVVDFMLDLMCYTVDRPLERYRLLEPSFGAGDFLLRAVARLLVVAGRDGLVAGDLRDAVRGVELHGESFARTRVKLLAMLAEAEFSKNDAEELAGAWLVNGDFLLENFPMGFDFVVGNPPYVRQEIIPAELLAAYRQRYATLYDRADLYVPFMERSLQLLKAEGQLGFICSDRWMKNRYGGPLREMISRGFSLRYYVDMVGTAAFQSEVIAYPAITVIQRGGGAAKARIAYRPEISVAALGHLHDVLVGPVEMFNGTVTELAAVAQGSDPWLLEADAQPSLALVRRLEAEFPALEEAGCTVGIGVATGADKIYIGPMAELDVEDERKLPLAMTRDILNGSVEWRGLGVVNPFEEDGSLADFKRYPRFAAYIKSHEAALMKRHCAQRANGSWYRTIDRITPSLARTPKLLIPDIKGEANIVLENGGLYPHHNLYFLLSRDWPLQALQAVLLAGIARLFVRAYSTKMRGGCLRFQAQYLRRIRLPLWGEISSECQRAFSRAAAAGDAAAMQVLVSQVYRLTAAEQLYLTD